MTHRQRQAQATRDLIVAAAQDLFLGQGYASTTIEGIASKAGVAVSTVYTIFGNKRGILKAIREAWHQESRQRDIYNEALHQPDPKRRLELAAHATRRQWETGTVVTAIYQSAAAADREAAAELQEALAGRRASIRRFVQETITLMKPTLDVEHALAIFLALTLPEVYREFVGVWGWSPDEYEAWLATALKQQLLP
jgi:AcrR family transcriptional regulator